MFVVLTQKVFRAPTNATEKYSLRSRNEVRWTVSGPFTRRPLAERAALAAMATHTCLSAEIHCRESLAAIPLKRYADGHHQPDHAQDLRQKGVIAARIMLGIPDLEGAPTPE